jgi:hypothetical protein
MATVLVRARHLSLVPLAGLASGLVSGLARVGGAIVMLLDVYAEALDLMREAQRRYPFTVS